MCGITGIARFDDQPFNQDRLVQMRDALGHRGPDDAGIYINDAGSVGLAHRRLSIIDLSSRAHQPMSTEDGMTWIIHSGEIYNFAEIKKELVKCGHDFMSGSDTEVILRGYCEWGEEIFNKLQGMFAFSLYDRDRGLLYLVRDHAGIKPFYYSVLNGQLIFSSEVRAFRVFDRTWEENRDWRIFFLTFGHLPEPYTTLEGVHMLPKGSFLKADLNKKGHTIQKYAQFEFTDEISDTEEAVRGTRDILTKAVERHFISDAPIGVFLSGGMDSSLVALIAHAFQKENLSTLSVVFDEKEYSEKTYQDIVLGRIASRHHSCLVTEKDFMDNLDDIFGSMDQPTIDGVNTYFISKCAKEAGLKSVLSGLGGDELFGGYPSFSRINSIWPLRDSSMTGLLKMFQYSGSDKLKKLSFLSLKNALGYYLLFRGLYTPESVARLLDVHEQEVCDALEKVYIKMPENISRRNFVSYLETNLYMQNQLLKDTDFMGMRHSIEVRVPFLDKELMNFVFSVKEKSKFNSGMPKHLLVRSFEDILPHEIVTRKKHGFTFPFDSWIRKNSKSIFHEALSHAPFNKNFAEQLWNKFEQGDMHWSRVWGIAVLARRK